MSKGVRLGVVDDHRAIAKGVPAGLDGRVPLEREALVATTVDELLSVAGDLDVVLLDIRLGDGSSAPENVGRLAERGWAVLLYTAVRQPSIIGRCLQAGAMGVVGKHEDWGALADAVRTVAGGDHYVNADWASALECVATVPSLAPRESQVLQLYAAGLPMKSVARKIGISEETAKEYLTRVKRKYLDAGRPARTKTELFRRAVEDGHLDGPGES